MALRVQEGPPLKTQIYRLRSLRRIILPLLKRADRDIVVRHHWTDEPLHLRLYRHKGYWYHGRSRERETMLRFARMIRRGEFAIEIGAHIGYISMYLAQLVGPEGKLIVFEPAPDNLTYLRKNVDSDFVTVVDRAVADHQGHADLHVEDLTGQNNSLLPHYNMLERNEAFADARANKRIVRVSCVRLDDYLEQHGLPVPRFVKIDVEGAEHLVLQGMQKALTSPDIALMVEVTERASDVVELLRSAGFRLFRPNAAPIENTAGARGNIFCLKDTDDRLRIFS